MDVGRLKIKMLWDSGASVTVLNEQSWTKLGNPQLSVSKVLLSGVFSSGGEKPLGSFTTDIEWNGKVRQMEIIVVKKLQPDFIGGVDMMEKFGIKLCEVNNIEAADLAMKFSDDDRVNNAMIVFRDQDSVQLRNLLRRFGKIFMASTFDIGHTKLVRHDIIVTGTPISQSPRRQAMHLEPKVDEMVLQLLDAGVISRCKSAWNSPLVVVGKKDGSIRVCVDFRRINAITEKYTFPMPDMQMLLDCLADSKYFSSIDLGQAYYQVELTENARPITAFSTKQGQFCFNRMPFGLATAPATFQKLMHELLDGLLFKGVLVYLDDILIYSSCESKHNEILEMVLSRIEKAGLRVNPGKCRFHQRELVFLGHTVSAKGVQTNRKKVEEVMKAKPPVCVSQLRSFLGLTNYYRRFINHYAEVAAPLYAAISGGDEKLQWTDRCQSSFEELKNKLCQAPVLDFPRRDRVFILDTDASFGAIGSVLSQLKEDGTETVIAYGSRHLSAHELGYCVTRKELLALYEFVLHFKQYLYGKRFIVRTDHKALVFMNTTKNPISPQFQTWFANLSEFNFELRYRKGQDHSNADGLSRIADVRCSQCQTKHEQAKLEKPKTRYISFVHDVNTRVDRIRGEQNSDKLISGFRQYFSEGGREYSEELRKSNLYVLRNNLDVWNELLVLRRNDRNLIIIPGSFVEEFVNEIHAELCHFGSKKIFNYLQDHYFWPSMWNSIKSCLKSCLVCAKRKIDQTRTKELLIPRRSSQFLEQIVVDIAYMEKAAFHFKYLVVIIDRFSKLVSLSAITKLDDQSIFKAIMNNWIYKFGRPRSILTDRGRNFESSWIQQQWKDLNIECEFSSPYQHQSNGLVERVIRTIRDMITTSLKGGCQEKNWHDLLPRIEYSINATQQSSTKFSPFEIVFGYKINLHSGSNDQVIPDTRITLEARRNLEIAAGKMNNFEKNIRGQREFQLGEKVLLRREPQHRKKNDFQYDGPYRISRFLSPHQVELEGPEGTKLRRIEWLKKWKQS